MFIYKSRFMTRGEVWFDEEPNGARVDWIFHRQRSSPLWSGRCREVYTRLIPLQRTSAQLLEAMEPRTAQKIKDAQEKDKLSWQRFERNDRAVLDEAEAWWNEFAVAQRTTLFEREWLEPMLDAGMLDLTGARDAAGKVLAYHLVFIAPRRARQLVAISPYKAAPGVAWREAVSRANCFIHWNNFQNYRDMKIPHFDFGGWHVGKADIRLLGFNAFKKGFGGSVVQEYDCEQPKTFKARLLLGMARLFASLKEARLSPWKESSRPNHSPEEASNSNSNSMRAWGLNSGGREGFTPLSGR